MSFRTKDERLQKYLLLGCLEAMKFVDSTVEISVCWRTPEAKTTKIFSMAFGVHFGAKKFKDTVLEISVDELPNQILQKYLIWYSLVIEELRNLRILNRKSMVGWRPPEPKTTNIFPMVFGS